MKANPRRGRARFRENAGRRFRPDARNQQPVGVRSVSHDARTTGAQQIFEKRRPDAVDGPVRVVSTGLAGAVHVKLIADPVRAWPWFIAAERLAVSWTSVVTSFSFEREAVGVQNIYYYRLRACTESAEVTNLFSLTASTARHFYNQSNPLSLRSARTGWNWKMEEHRRATKKGAPTKQFARSKRGGRLRSSHTSPPPTAASSNRDWSTRKWKSLTIRPKCTLKLSRFQTFDSGRQWRIITRNILFHRYVNLGRVSRVL